MATKCIDISENKKLKTTSPFAMFAFVFIFIALTAFMEPGIIYFVMLLVAFVFTQIFFQYKPRFVFLLIKYLKRNTYLTPSFSDKDYFVDESKIKAVDYVTNKSLRD